MPGKHSPTKLAERRTRALRWGYITPKGREKTAIGVTTNFAGNMKTMSESDDACGQVPSGHRAIDRDKRRLSWADVPAAEALGDDPLFFEDPWRRKSPTSSFAASPSPPCGVSASCVAPRARGRDRFCAPYDRPRPPPASGACLDGGGDAVPTPPAGGVAVKTFNAPVRTDKDSRSAWADVNMDDLECPWAVREHNGDLDAGLQSQQQCQQHLADCTAFYGGGLPCKCVDVWPVMMQTLQKVSASLDALVYDRLMRSPGLKCAGLPTQEAHDGTLDAPKTEKDFILPADNDVDADSENQHLNTSFGQLEAKINGISDQLARKADTSDLRQLVSGMQSMVRDSLRSAIESVEKSIGDAITALGDRIGELQDRIVAAETRLGTMRSTQSLPSEVDLEKFAALEAKVAELEKLVTADKEASCDNDFCDSSGSPSACWDYALVSCRGFPPDARPHGRLCGLSNASLNGTSVRVVRFHSDTGRWEVRALITGKCMSVREQNVTPWIRDDAYPLHCQACRGVVNFNSLPQCDCESDPVSFALGVDPHSVSAALSVRCRTPQ